jgi:hypothetical protein
MSSRRKVRIHKILVDQRGSLNIRFAPEAVEVLRRREIWEF